MVQDSFQSRITADPEIRHGRPVIAGTRVPVEIVLGSLAGGMDVDAVCEEYDLERADVLAALDYARATIAGEEIHSLQA